MLQSRVFVFLVVAAVAGAGVLSLAAPAASTSTQVGEPSPSSEAAVSSALPTPGFNCDLSEAVTGRIFPEAMETNDFVSYEEALCGLQKLDEQHGDVVTFVPITESVGWDDAVTGERETFQVYSVEVTNEKSGILFEDKVKLVFQLSIHGNEKGGREGAFRVIEDFARGIGLAAENPELVEMLDYMALVFVFPNPDGWVHEELRYRHNDACYVSLTCSNDDNAGEPGLETQSFVRVNGNGVDLNREWPTVGWYHEPYTAMSEPEVVGVIDYLNNLTNVRYASDIHGMLNPADMNPEVAYHEAGPEVRPADRGHFVLTMLPAGRQSPQEMYRNTALADLVKETLNGNDYYAEWQSIPTTGVWGGEFNDWGTVWDTIGYTDSGFTSDWYAQDHGLNAAGVDFELSYNHITFDNYYPGLTQRINAYHVENVRDIVTAFMTFAAKEYQVAVDTQGTRTAYVESPVVVTNADNMNVDGWAAENEADDLYDIGHVLFRSSINDYFVDLKDDLASSEGEPVLDPLPRGGLTASVLAGYDNLVVPGSAYANLRDDPASLDALRAWVEQGGRLFASDEALLLLEDLGLVDEGSVDSDTYYAGFSDFPDRGHDLLTNVRGLARETFEPVPLGYSVRGGHTAPIWFVDAAAFDGEVVGFAGEETRVNFGRTTLGDGSVVFLGAFLPDPSTDHYHPYGLDSYATTYTANQILRNALGWTEVVDTTPVDPASLAAAQAEDAPAEESADRRFPVPSAGLVSVLSTLGAALLVLRRR